MNDKIKINDKIDKIKVLLVDDHELAREGLRRVLELDPNITVVGEASDGQEGLAKVDSLSPDVILMDLRMPTLGGLDASRLLRKRGLSCKVIILSFYDEYLAEAIEAGVAGYLIKDVRRDELLSAIRRVHEGEIVLGSSLFTDAGQAEHVLAKLRERARQKPAPAGEFLPIEVIVQPPAPSIQVLSLLTRLLAKDVGSIVDFEMGQGSEARLLFSVEDAKRFEAVLLELTETSYAWEEGVKKGADGPLVGAGDAQADPQPGLRMRVVLKPSSTPRGPHA